MQRSEEGAQHAGQAVEVGGGACAAVRQGNHRVTVHGQGKRVRRHASDHRAGWHRQAAGQHGQPALLVLDERHRDPPPRQPSDMTRADPGDDALSQPLPTMVTGPLARPGAWSASRSRDQGPSTVTSAGGSSSRFTRSPRSSAQLLQVRDLVPQPGGELEVQLGGGVVHLRGEPWIRVARSCAARLEVSRRPPPASAESAMDWPRAAPPRGPAGLAPSAAQQRLRCRRPRPSRSVMSAMRLRSGWGSSPCAVL